MLQIPAGEFWWGSPEGEGDADEHPQIRVWLPSYCIDRYEVTVAQYARCVSEGSCRPAPSTINWDGATDADRNNYNPVCNAGRSGVDNHPINCVDWTMADAYCRAVGRRLPSEAEWEYAARGSDGRRYPWGNEAPSANLLNACGSECVAWARARGWNWGSMYSADDGWPTTSPVGSFPSGASPFGVMDMAGNVWEWTSDWYAASYAGYSGSPVVNPTGPTNGQFRVDRGGGWGDSEAGRVRAADRGRDGTAGRDASMGFRCARGAS